MNKQDTAKTTHGT